MALRIRRSGSGVELTVKRYGEIEGAIHRRPETTWSLRHMPRLPLRLRRADLRREIEPFSDGRAIVPLVGTRIRRRAILVLRGGGTTPIAEIACDEVTYFLPAGADATRPRTTYEVEVELLGGEEKDLRAIVRALRARYSLDRTGSSKLARALRWARIGVRGRRSTTTFASTFARRCLDVRDAVRLARALRRPRQARRRDLGPARRALRARASSASSSRPARLPRRAAVLSRAHGGAARHAAGRDHRHLRARRVRACCCCARRRTASLGIGLGASRC